MKKKFFYKPGPVVDLAPSYWPKTKKLAIWHFWPKSALFPHITQPFEGSGVVYGQLHIDLCTPMDHWGPQLSFGTNIEPLKWFGMAKHHQKPQKMVKFWGFLMFWAIPNHFWGHILVSNYCPSQYLSNDVPNSISSWKPAHIGCWRKKDNNYI